ncbi:MAG: PilZ domain-containing protein [bacterium]|nr:PilZ domain-containing protein [bacterium]
MGKKDQRQHARERCSIITDYIVDNHNYKGIMLNIAPSGAFIASRHLFPVNQVIFQSFFSRTLKSPFGHTAKLSGRNLTDLASSSTAFKVMNSIQGNEKRKGRAQTLCLFYDRLSTHHLSGS